MDLKIIDNVVSSGYATYLEQTCSGRLDNDWGWRHAPAADDEDNNYNFAKWILNSNTDINIKTKWFDTFIPVLFNAVDDFESIYRIRAGMFIKNQCEYTHKPHVDLQFPHTTLLYYVNDSDGSTKFYENGEIVEEVHPKKGRCVIFDGSIVHAAAHPVNHMERITINYNFVPKK